PNPGPSPTEPLEASDNFPIACGKAVCNWAVLPTGYEFFSKSPVAAPCCVDEASSTCGIVGPANQCLPFRVPGTPGRGCIGIMAGNRLFPACCRADHACGVMETELGLGCIDRSKFAPGVMT